MQLYNNLSSVPAKDISKLMVTWAGLGYSCRSSFGQHCWVNIRPGCHSCSSCIEFRVALNTCVYPFYLMFIWVLVVIRNISNY